MCETFSNTNVKFLENFGKFIVTMIAGASRGRRCTYGDIRRYTCADISVDAHRGSLFDGVSKTGWNINYNKLFHIVFAFTNWNLIFFFIAISLIFYDVPNCSKIFRTFRRWYLLSHSILSPHI